MEASPRATFHWKSAWLHVLQIHWFSIINSCVTVLLLTGFLATILMRVLKNDFMKFTRDDEIGELVSAVRVYLHCSLSSVCLHVKVCVRQAVTVVPGQGVAGLPWTTLPCMQAVVCWRLVGIAFVQACNNLHCTGLWCPPTPSALTVHCKTRS